MNDTHGCTNAYDHVGYSQLPYARQYIAPTFSPQYSNPNFHHFYLMLEMTIGKLIKPHQTCLHLHKS
jgi:hypothetical protein